VTGQSRQVGLTCQPGWLSLDRTERTGLPGHRTGIQRAVDKNVWAEQLIGQLRKGSRDRIAGMGQPGQDN
jgi:hypothetical protein